MRDVFPKTRWQRDWVHKTANVLDALPKSVHRATKRTVHEITEAENKPKVSRAIERFRGDFGGKWPRAVAKITSAKEVLLSFYDFPAEHWVHLRITNRVEPT